MATGSVSGTEESASLPVVTNSPTFIDFLRSPTWMYPTSRFFGDALYGDCSKLIYLYIHILYAPVEYNYDINFIDCQGDQTIQKRKEVLYESYCDLVSYCK